MYRDFCEAYALAPVAEMMALPLQQQFGDARIQGTVKQLTEARSVDPYTEEPESQKNAPSLQHSDEWYERRRAELKRQADELLARRKS
jgi:hypothetical protein